MIPEKEREAIMRLTMCARRSCAICIYGYQRKRVTVKLPQSCLDRITENMNLLAAAMSRIRPEAPKETAIKEWEPIYYDDKPMNYRCPICGFWTFTQTSICPRCETPLKGVIKHE